MLTAMSVLHSTGAMFEACAFCCGWVPQPLLQSLRELLHATRSMLKRMVGLSPR